MKFCAVSSNDGENVMDTKYVVHFHHAFYIYFTLYVTMYHYLLEIQ